MLALLQRVTHARVDVDNTTIGEIKNGLLIFLGVEKQDNEKTVKRLLERILNYRIFSDEQDKMNLNVQQLEGGLLIVPQFTLPADTKKRQSPRFFHLQHHLKRGRPYTIILSTLPMNSITQLQQDSLVQI